MRIRILAVFALAATSLLGFAPSAHAEAKYKIRWYLGHKNLDYFEEAALNFKKEVETKSHGDVSVELVIADRDDLSAGLGAGSNVAAMVEKGEAEMGHSFTDVVGGLDPRLYAFEAPYLFRDYRHMEGVIEGPLGQELLDGFQAHGMQGLSFTYSGGGSGVASVDREIRKPEDLQGLKVGVYGDALNEAWLTGLGAKPVTIKHNLGNILPASRSGELDAAVITWRNFERAALDQGFRYFSMPNSTYLVSVTYINQKFFKSLPAEYRTLISDASRESGRVERALTIELNERAKRAMVGQGVRPVYLNAEGKRGFEKALAPAYASSIEGLIGKDFLRRIRATADGPAQPAVAVDLAGR